MSSKNDSQQTNSNSKKEQTTKSVKQQKVTTITSDFWLLCVFWVSPCSCCFRPLEHTIITIVFVIQVVLLTACIVRVYFKDSLKMHLLILLQFSLACFPAYVLFVLRHKHEISQWFFFSFDPLLILHFRTFIRVAERVDVTKEIDKSNKNQKKND